MTAKSSMALRFLPATLVMMKATGKEITSVSNVTRTENMAVRRKILR